MTRYVFDLEADNLLDDLTKIHCIVLRDLDTGEVLKAEPFEVSEMVERLQDADLIVGHNVIGYDLPALCKVYPSFELKDSCVVRDTLVMTRLASPDLSDKDQKLVALGNLPKTLIGSHSLAAWGYRLGLHKSEYEGGFEEFNAEMLDYCVQDTAVTLKLWEVLLDADLSETAIDVEHSVALICAEQERHGWSFNETKALDLEGLLVKRKAEIEADLQTVFEPITTERYSEKTGRRLKDHVEVFNPGSRQQIGKRLMALGWKPDDFTPSGQPKIDETILSKLDIPQAKPIAEYLMLTKRLGQLSDGDNAWLKMVKDGRIHGRVITNGAVTGRATHRNPNLAQVPATGAPFGHECRELFIPSKGMVMLGADVSGLELRMLGHYMSPWDKGKYAKEVVSGDIHTTNQEAAGLPTRNDAKTFIYAFLYGAGDFKIGTIINKGAQAGKAIKAAFFKKVPALKALVDTVQNRAEGRGYLLGLDGRKLKIRSSHAALNTLLQSAGAIVCKVWMIEAHKLIKERAIRCHQLGWIHDELQFECHPDDADKLGATLVEAISIAGTKLKISVPLTGEYKIGESWADTH